MPRRRLFLQIFPLFIFISLVSLLFGAWYVLRVVREAHVAELTSELTARCRLLVEPVRQKLGVVSADEFQSWCRELGGQASGRVTIISLEGVPLGDSDEVPSQMDNHLDRPEIAAALTGRAGNSIRWSNTLKREMLYVALPIMKEEHVSAVVRIAVPLEFVENSLQAIFWKLALGACFLAVLSTLAGYVFARRVARPLEEMKRIADRFAAGDLSPRMPVSGSEEVGGLADKINQMAARMDDRIRALALQRNEEDAMLLGMVEGVLAVDAQERILKMNQSAGRLLGLDPAHAAGRDLQEVVRNADLQKLVAETLNSGRANEGEILFTDSGEERYMQVHCTLLRDERSGVIGALAVFNDVTHLRRLERVRRDFVANVSHELKTPITSIKGFVETLLAGALDEPEEARRFLEIVARQSDRLNSIIEDLLSLSRIEQESEKGEIALEQSSIRDAVQGAIFACGHQAEEKNVTIQFAAGESFEAQINAALLEQAVVNLVDNAIKYSESGDTVVVSIEKKGMEIAISVKDSGCGISREHMPRIFERFYRVDKARSRKLGGTGLGLAIVKHIAQAHQGRVSAESVMGEGSIFTLYFPERP